MSVQHFNKLVKLAARAFYDDLTTKGENQPKTGRSDNRGIAVVVLDALTRRRWVREEDLAKDLKLHAKQLRRTLNIFEAEKIITRDSRKETVKGAKLHNAAAVATADGQPTIKEGEEKVKMHMHSYCCLDYAQIFDVVRYRLHRMKKKLKDELENKNTVQQYICVNCSKRYNALDALRLISMEDEDFHCESCNGKLEVESDKLASQEGGDGDDNAKKRRHETLKNMLQRIEVQLKPLMDQLNRVKELPVPEIISLQAWEAQASRVANNGDRNGNDPSKSSHGYSGTAMPFVADTKVVVDFTGGECKGEDIKSETDTNSLKVLPPWMITQRMNLTKEQRGEVKQEPTMVKASTSAVYSEDKKSAIEDENKKIIHDAYIQAYYDHIRKQQEELSQEEKQNQLSDTLGPDGAMASQRQVGMKSKREEEEGDDDVDWVETPVAGNTNENYKVNDLNVEADASGDDADDDDIDWEEG